MEACRRHGRLKGIFLHLCVCIYGCGLQAEEWRTKVGCTGESEAFFADGTIQQVSLGPR